MAFVGRRNTVGKLVDCQVITAMGTSSLPMSELSDEDTDSGNLNGYSNRSYVTPTVRYVAKEEDDDPESCLTYDGQGDKNLDNDIESVSSLSDSYDNEPGDAPDVNGDYHLDMSSDGETIMCSTSSAKSRYGQNTYADPAAEPDDLDSIDGDTICSPRDDAKLLSEDDRSLDSFDGPLDPACRSGQAPHLEADDAQSLSSMDSSTYCRNTVLPEDAFSLGSLGSSTLSHLSDAGNSLDNASLNQADTQSQLSTRTYNVKGATVRREDCSSASTCSWTDMYGGALKQSESRGNIVPALSLSTTSSSGSSTYFRNLDLEKEHHGQQAYQEWLKRKEQQKLQKVQAAKHEREKHEAESALRQRLAKERYEEWCRQKELKQKKPTTSSFKSTASSYSYPGSSSSGSTSGRKPAARKEAPEVTKKHLEDWGRIKTKQQQRERELQRQQQHRREQEEMQRKQKSEGAWQNWMKSVGKRAKPVPLNQGFDTLRGTISNIYVNPIQWVSNIDPKDSRGN